jgi:hypothetical protein
MNFNDYKSNIYKLIEWSKQNYKHPNVQCLKDIFFIERVDFQIHTFRMCCKKNALKYFQYHLVK